ncbi:hypothetical protein BX600DRAFT_162052 [Xylariales sp. PMI_506]|nr:hypothetical protein BX600DRAFT_162052 [Xylariales sp. PMI_506]
MVQAKAAVAGQPAARNDPGSPRERSSVTVVTQQGNGYDDIADEIVVAVFSEKSVVEDNPAGDKSQHGRLVNQDETTLAAPGEEKSSDAPAQKESSKKGRADSYIPRRSGRSRKVPANYEDEYVIPASQNPQPPPESSRRADAPKRKAAVEAEKAIERRNERARVTEVLTTPVTADELKGFKGWVELESEPLFFQAMLQDLGASHLKITELFSTDEESLAALPQPVHGLVFLFLYDEHTETGEERHECPEDLWFANQTTANACATVALMNIVMNIPDATFGPQLQSFKEQTSPLSSPHRGHALDTNDFIRCIHNSVARRVQLLGEDLALKYRAEDWEKEQRKKSRATKGGKRGRGKGRNRKKNTVIEESAHHYVAYVPHAGKVWELDGLERLPLCLGDSHPSGWLQTAIETIQVRMAAGDFSNTFNLLAMCSSPLKHVQDDFSANLRSCHFLEQRYGNASGGDGGDDSGNGGEPGSWPHPLITSLYPETKLAAAGLSWDVIKEINTESEAQILADLRGLAEVDSTSPAAAAAGASTPVPKLTPTAAATASKLMGDLLAKQQEIEVRLALETADRDAAAAEWAARRRDYTPAMHRLLQCLAENEQLERVVDEHRD